MTWKLRRDTWWHSGRGWWSTKWPGCGECPEPVINQIDSVFSYWFGHQRDLFQNQRGQLSVKDFTFLVVVLEYHFDLTKIYHGLPFRTPPFWWLHSCAWWWTRRRSWRRRWRRRWGRAGRRGCPSLTFGWKHLENTSKLKMAFTLSLPLLTHYFIYLLLLLEK